MSVCIIKLSIFFSSNEHHASVLDRSSGVKTNNKHYVGGFLREKCEIRV
jgi:hypothetical protein